MAQADTLSITLKPFTKKEGQTETLYVAVSIKSNIPGSIEIDDSRSWMTCVNAFGVKLVTQTLYDGCFEEARKSDGHPLYTTSGNYFDEITKRIKPAGFEELSYIVEVLDVPRVEENGLKRTFKNFNTYRFKLELPYKHGTNGKRAISKNWVYYAYQR